MVSYQMRTYFHEDIAEMFRKGAVEYCSGCPHYSGNRNRGWCDKYKRYVPATFASVCRRQ